LELERINAVLFVVDANFVLIQGHVDEALIYDLLPVLLIHFLGGV
jgi:hypothetical protein